MKEITITAKENDDENSYEVRTVLYEEDCYMNSSINIEKPNTELKYGSKKLQEIVSDTEDIGLWGIIGQNDQYYWKSGESVIDMAKRSGWAIILKLEFSDEFEYLP